MNQSEFDEIRLKDEMQILASRADVVRTQSIARSALPTRRLSPLIGFGVGAAAASAAVVAALAFTSGSGSSAGETASSGTPTKASQLHSGGDGVASNFSQPCEGAHKESLEQVQREATIPVTTSSPENSKFTSAYFCAGGPAQPALAYGEVYLTYETGWAKVDLEKGWAVRIQREAERPYITTFQGDPALVDPADPKDPHVVPEILVVRGDYLIRVQGEPGASIEPLIDVASHLDKTPGVS